MGCLCSSHKIAPAPKYQVDHKASNDAGSRRLSIIKSDTLQTKAAIQRKSETSEVLPYLRRTNFASRMTPDGLAKVAEHFELLRFSAGSVIVEEGQRITRLYHIADGEVDLFAKSVDNSRDLAQRQVSKRTVKGTHRRYQTDGTEFHLLQAAVELRRCDFTHGTFLCTKSEGDTIGIGQLPTDLNAENELELRWVCTVVACKETLCLSLKIVDFSTAILPGIKTAEAMKLCLGSGLLDRLRDLSFLSGIADIKLQQLALMFHIVPLAANEMLFQEWDFDEDNGSALYFLYEGELSVIVTTKEEGQKEVATIGPGTFFGELGLILHMPRTATIRAKTDCVTMELRSKDFANFAKLAPQALINFRSKLHEYSISLKHLIHSRLAIKYFKMHLQREFSEENLLFWLEAKKFRFSDHDDAEVPQRARAIVEKYIRNGAPLQVNINHTRQQEILAAFDAGRVDSNMFVAAEKDILDLMDRDSFVRFKQSELFGDFVDSIQSGKEDAPVPVSPQGAVRSLQTNRQSLPMSRRRSRTPVLPATSRSSLGSLPWIDKFSLNPSGPSNSQNGWLDSKSNVRSKRPSVVSTYRSTETSRVTVYSSK